MKAKRYCTAFGCLNNNKYTNLSFYTLPKDTEKRRKWLTLVDREDLLQKEDLNWRSYAVCSVHFEDKSIKVKKILKENALPTMNYLNHTQGVLSSSSEAQSTSAKINDKVTVLSNKIINHDSSYLEAQSTSAQIKDKGTPTQIKDKGTPTQIKGKGTSTQIKGLSAQIKDKGTPTQIKGTSTQTKRKRTFAQIKGKSIILSNKNIKEEKYVTVGTQTESSQSTEQQQTQTLKSLTDRTPRKRKLSKELSQCGIKCRKLEREFMKIEKELEANNKSITCNDPDDEIDRRFRKLVEWQNKVKNKYKGNRYDADAEYKVFALNLHYSSPCAYRSLQTVLKLPSKRTLNRY